MFRIKTIPFFLLFVLLSTLAADEPQGTKSVAGYAREAGSLPVEVVESLTLRDEKRKTDLVVRVHYPKGDGPFPVIVFSHGFGAGKDAFAVIGKHWASHGYITIHPNHADGGKLGQMKGNNQTEKRKEPSEKDREELRKRLQESLKNGEKGGMGGSSGLSDRVRDVSAVIDALEQLEAKIPNLKGKLNKDRIGVSGHSFGAATAMLVGGITADLDGEKGKSFLDARVKCILPFSGAGTGEYGLTKDSFQSSKLPTLYVTGTKDIRPGKTFEWRREAFDGSPANDKYLVVMDGATHFHFGGGPPGGNRLGGVGGRGGDKYTPFVKDVSVAFFDAYLKGSEKAKTYLKDGFAKQSGTTVTVESK